MERAAELGHVGILADADRNGGTPAADTSRFPLCVDLDGTLLTIDTFQEAAVAAFLQDPRMVLSLPRWLAQGKARLKQELAARWDFDPALLPYNFFVLDYLQQQRAQGRTLILATGPTATSGKDRRPSGPLRRRDRLGWDAQSDRRGESRSADRAVRRQGLRLCRQRAGRSRRVARSCRRSDRVGAKAHRERRRRPRAGRNRHRAARQRCPRPHPRLAAPRG